MAEVATISCNSLIDSEAEEQRVLADVNQLLNHLESDGSISPSALRDMEQNYVTAVDERALPSVVSRTIQRVETRQDTNGRSERVIKFLGKTIVDVAMDGYKFYVTNAGRRRGAIEVDEAVFQQSAMEPGMADAFISPQMSRHDAPVDVAKAENLYGQDAVRVSYSVKDKSGEIVARRIESLLVSDVPLQAWIDMLKDDKNMFGKAFKIVDEGSAVSVMQLFKDMRLPEEQLPEGPVTILKAVRPHINDQSQSDNLAKQIKKFETGQAVYQKQSLKTARKWLEFDIELARSLKQGMANQTVERLIATLQHQWSEDDLRIIQAHDIDGIYIMTNQLAAVLEKAKSNLLVSEAALVTGNEKVLSQTDKVTAANIVKNIRKIEMMRRLHCDPAEIAFRESLLARSVARQNFRVEGGCAGGSSGFRTKNNEESTSATENALKLETAESSAGWIWKKGSCRIKQCTSPKPTEVGPCSICRNCQQQFDRGQDPTLGADTAAEPQEARPRKDLWNYLALLIKNGKPAASALNAKI